MSSGSAVAPGTEAALVKLADVVVPPRPSLLPQTWGWLGLALVLLVLVAWRIARARRRRAANRYRTDALASLATLEGQIAADATRAAALLAVPPLLKRVALAVWPREQVAPLTRRAWIAFLEQHRGDGPELDDALRRLLDDAEYRPQRSPTSADDARAVVRAARGWIEGHRGPA